jgi:hypothetical protein
MPLFTKFREALGEQRPLIEAPGHLVTPAEAGDAISIITVALLFIWNCHALSASDRDAVSHRTMNSAGLQVVTRPLRSASASRSRMYQLRTQIRSMHDHQMGDIHQLVSDGCSGPIKPFTALSTDATGCRGGMRHEPRSMAVTR